MRFLIDRCAGHRLAEWLRQGGHDVAEMLDRGPDPGDRTVLETAVKENRLLVTLDKDFGDLLFVEGLAHLVIRLPDVPAEGRIRLMEHLLANNSAELAERAIITHTGRPHSHFTVSVAAVVEIKATRWPDRHRARFRTGLDAGFVTLISLMALISLNLGVLNALPIPILDGGVMMLLIIEPFHESCHGLGDIA